MIYNNILVLIIFTCITIGADMSEFIFKDYEVWNSNFEF